MTMTPRVLGVAGALGLLCATLMPVARAAPQAPREKHWAFVPPTRPAVFSVAMPAAGLFSTAGPASTVADAEFFALR